MSGVDFRGQQTPVRDQLTRGTCAAFATTAAHEWVSRDAPDLSEEFAVWAGKQVDPSPGEACYVEDILVGLEHQGHALTAAWPYGVPAYPADPPAAALVTETRRTLPGWRSVPHDLHEICAAIEAEEAVVLSLRFVPDAWYRAAQDGRVYLPSPPSATVGGHAVLAVGLERDVDDMPLSLIVKNSWGSGWGKDGYGYLSTEYVRSHTFAVEAITQPFQAPLESESDSDWHDAASPTADWSST